MIDNAKLRNNCITDCATMRNANYAKLDRMRMKNNVFLAQRQALNCFQTSLLEGFQNIIWGNRKMGNDYMKIAK